MNVLVVYYTQSGQLKEIADNLVRPLEKHNIVWYKIEPEKDYPFPWNGEEFFGAFPEAFGQKTIPLKPIPEEILNQKFDLILFHYQVWFLSPSIPITSFVKSEGGKKLLSSAPVVTISATRNMWIKAQEKLKVLLKAAGATLVGNIALVDKAGNLVSVVTIVDWLFSGVKRKYLGVLPMPGVSEEDIKGAERFGDVIGKHLEGGTLSSLQSDLVKEGAVHISSFLLSVDQKGNKIFSKWLSIIEKNPKKRKFLLKLFNVYVVLALYVVSPIVFLFHYLTYPFWRSLFLKEKAYYQSV
ncbi:hypothetical protein Lbys_1509 [Leadbetterella byssophila DSM 17132]|uniref:Dialkylresorcinol condensing enzyme DarA n=1 Tax=Leadbetterella byssophila (strain DSM 17132 / JCM 16389 / KACC 11308 / NBRC 106382 / 4M15) TaxID=649349 RepID=E4RXI7_LEAB4|nr:hypothetical protein [Leadbetterella byssophila]ADQ17222.1 hypothetical protein Lbys_1509 [Leadbetterella byssophila DSM 17132]